MPLEPQIAVLNMSDDLVRLHTGHLAPRSFDAVVQVPNGPHSSVFGIRVADNGEPWLQSFAVIPAPCAEPVSVLDALRGVTQEDVAFVTEYATSLAVASLLPAPSEPATWPNLPDRNTPDGQLAWARVMAQAEVAVGVRSHKRRRVNDELLRRVVSVYRNAVDEGRTDPTVAVSEKEHVSRSTAAKYVMAARKRGLLGPAAGRRGGEITEGDGQ